MSKFKHIQNNFTSGEVDPKFQGRTDLVEYNNSLDLCENFIIQKQGGAVKRPGSQFVKDINAAIANPKRMIPFIFSKTEAYNIILSGDASTRIRIIKNDGTIIPLTDVDDTAYARPPFIYDPKNWKYTQSGDILVLSFSAPTESLSLGAAASSIGNQNQIAPVMIIRTSLDKFTILTFNHPDFIAQMPSTGKFSPAVMRPYLAPNIDPDIRFYVDVVAIGPGRDIFAVDSNDAFVPFFTRGHSFADSGGNPTRIGSFIKVQVGANEGVAWGESWFADRLEVSGNINTGTDIVTTALAHGLEDKDLVTLGETGLGGSTDPVITNFPLTNSFYGEFFVNNQSATTLSFHTSEADAVADANRIDFTSAGDRGLRIQFTRIHTMPITIEVDMPATLTSAANASDNWQEAAWSSNQGFPRAVTFHEQRLMFGGTLKKPDTFWISNVGNIFNFMARRLESDVTVPTAGSTTNSGFGFILSGAILPTNPTDFTIASTQANAIQWMQSQDSLLIGTLGAEYVVNGGDEIISNQSVFCQKAN